MMKPDGLAGEFTVIGENIHATRVVLRGGKLVGEAPGGGEAVRYVAPGGETRYLPIPEEFKRRQDYQEGRVKHVMIAVRSAMSPDPAARDEGLAYLGALVARQVAAGADFLDLNIDEISVRLAEQKEAMRWLVRAVEPLSPVPLSIDSSNIEILREGIEACAGRPMLNSASLERIDALDLARDHDLPVIVTAAGESGMPQDAAGRVANAARMIEAARGRGIPLSRVHVDALVFPVSVDVEFGNHYLEALRALRGQFGGEIHLTGGLSNVSFGLPCRKLVNEAFIDLAAEAGADGGIVDPVANDLHRLFRADREARPYQLARDLLLGRDRNCRTFLKAYRAGELGPK
jgi:5-methyltetrahydrofolate--homocysteine methyltransferase